MAFYNYQELITRGKGKNIYSPHGRLFMCMTNRYFGHTDIKHYLNVEDVTNNLSKEDVRLSMKVKFKHKKTYIRGKVTKMNPKRARITLDNGGKFTVPYEVLERDD